MTAFGDSMTARRDDEQEMTMEEILASIRKYVTEDGTTAANSTETNYKPHYETESEEDVLDLRLVSGSIIDHPEHAKPAPAAPAQQPQTTKAQPIFASQINAQSANVSSLSSGQTMAASAQSLSKLIETAKTAKQETNVMDQQPQSSQINVNPALQTTLEALAIQAMTPLVQSWLDANLPQLVEKLVQKEIQRITQQLMQQ